MKKILAGAVAALIVVALVLGISKGVTSDNKATDLALENIGEMATQSAYCTEVNVTGDDKKIFGITIPFTQSKYVYSYDFNIKAGYDFGEIKWKVSNKKIIVNLPEVRVLSNEIVEDSFKVFHEEESVFTPISLADHNEAVGQMKKDAEAHAVKNGLFDEAQSNAKVILKSFFYKEYDPDEYEIEFNFKEK